MSLGTLVLYIGIAAVLLTLLVGFVFKRQKSWLMSFLQNFCGVLFIFSGFVKAIDPLGTAYKMEQYFAEFESTFSDTALGFLAPMFPWLSSHSATFSVLMIIFEIVLGLMLVLGARPKFTSWAFFLLVAFFTILTGFTYLTGYVPQGVNFFEFGKWGAYVETNMKVTDCGCFGDFLKLEPKVSFLKDVFLLIPALFFLFKNRDMHQLFTERFRNAATLVTTFALAIFCLNNFVWNLPPVDFRPFYVGNDVRAKKTAEQEAEEAVEVLAYKLKNKQSGQVVELPTDQYLKEYKNYPKEEWEFEQVKSEPAIPRTKLSDFEVADLEGNDKTEDILSNENYHFMVVSYKLYGTSTQSTVTVQDTTWATDTIRLEGTDSIQLVQRVASVEGKEVSKEVYSFEPDFEKRYSAIINPIAAGAQKDGYDFYAVTAYADPGKIDDFRHATQSAFPFYVADDILLKTIVRSNPGLVLWKDGKIVMKWHWKQLPTYEEIKARYLK